MNRTYSRTLLRLLIAVFSVSFLPTALFAQTKASSDSPWQTLLSERIRPAYRNTYPDRLGLRCDAGISMPDSVALISGMAIHPNEIAPFIGKTWRPTHIGSEWEQLRAPVRNDTIWVQTVSVSCSPPTQFPHLLVENDGQFIELGSDVWATISKDGELKTGHVYVQAGAALEPAILTRDCTDSNCNWQLLDAAHIANERQLAHQARLEEEKRQAEAVRLAAERARAEAERARAAKEAGLRRHGATAEQVSAGMNGRVIAGMSPNVVREILGNPQRETEQVSALGTTVIWHYSGRIVEFISNRVTRIR